MSLAHGLAKTVVILFNVILGLMGIGFIVIGSLLGVAFKGYAGANIISPSYVWGPVATAIVLGLMMLAAAISGTVGVLSERRGALSAYITLLLLVICVQITIAVLTIVYGKKIEETFNSSFITGIQKAWARQSPDTELRTAIDTLQREGKCCGASGYKDYVNLQNAAKTSLNGLPPDSCCKTFTAGCSTVLTFLFPSRTYNTQGCLSGATSDYNRYSTTIIAVGSTFAFLEIFAVIYSCILCHRSGPGSAQSKIV